MEDDSKELIHINAWHFKVFWDRPRQEAREGMPTHHLPLFGRGREGAFPLPLTPSHQGRENQKVRGVSLR